MPPSPFPHLFQNRGHCPNTLKNHNCMFWRLKPKYMCAQNTHLASHWIKKLQSDLGKGMFQCSKLLSYSLIDVLPDLPRLFFWIAMWGTPENWGWDEFYTNGVIWASLADFTVTEQQLVKRTAKLLRFYMYHTGWVGQVMLLVLVVWFPMLVHFDSPPQPVIRAVIDGIFLHHTTFIYVTEKSC